MLIPHSKRCPDTPVLLSAYWGSCLFHVTKPSAILDQGQKCLHAQITSKKMVQPFRVLTPSFLHYWGAQLCRHVCNFFLMQTSDSSSVHRDLKPSEEFLEKLFHCSSVLYKQLRCPLVQSTYMHSQPPAGVFFLPFFFPSKE